MFIIDTSVLMIYKCRSFSEFFSQHASGGPPAYMLNHINIGDYHLIVLLKLLEILTVISPSRPITHNYNVISLLIHEVEHICAHSFDLMAINL